MSFLVSAESENPGRGKDLGMKESFGIESKEKSNSKSTNLLAHQGELLKTTVTVKTYFTIFLKATKKP